MMNCTTLKLNNLVIALSLKSCFRIRYFNVTSLIKKSVNYGIL